MTEDEIFAELATVTDPELRHGLEEELCRRLLRHATAITYILLHRARPDIAQHIVATAWEKMGTFRGEAKFSTWFEEIARRRCLYEIRRGKTGPEEVPLGEADVAVERDPVERLYTEWVLGQLGPEARRLYDLKVSGASDAEIAMRFQTSRVAIKQRWYYLRKKLRKLAGL